MKPQLYIIKEFVLMREARERLSEGMAIQPEEREELTMKRRERAQAQTPCGQKELG